MEFKLLTLITVLAENHLAYRGTLSDMCRFIGLAANNSRTNARIKEAIGSLCAKGFIRTIQDGRIWTLTLDRKASNRSKVIRIRQDWVLAAKAIQGKGVDWTIVLRVWLYLIDNKREIIRSSEIAYALGVSVDMISAAKKVLTDDLHAIVCNRVNKINPDGSFRCLGSNIDVNAWLDDEL